MDESSLTRVEAALATSRRESSAGNFTTALELLTVVPENATSTQETLCEIFRLRLILGDHRSISLTSVSTTATEHIEQYDELLSVQVALSRVSTAGELSESLEIATPLFCKYKNSLESEDTDYVIVSQSTCRLGRRSITDF